jgi:hypothetical protein
MLYLSLDGQPEGVYVRTDRKVKYPIGTPIRFDLDPAMVRFFRTDTEKAIQREVVTA